MTKNVSLEELFRVPEVKSSRFGWRSTARRSGKNFTAKQRQALSETRRRRNGKDHFGYGRDDHGEE